ncbi:MAG: hypothetical protein J4F37_04615 [Acidobacteria bacterium]|nr:hypothetical protein [Acidobacteriota bacterium]
MHSSVRCASRHFLLAAASVATALLLAVAPVAAQELEDWQRDELEPLVDVVASALDGELVPQDDPFALVPTFIKATDGNTYVPFTLSLDPDSIGDSVAIYLYIDEHRDVPVERDDDERPEAVWEEAHFVDVSESDGVVRISRAFTVPGGTYDVYVAIRDSAGPDGDRDNDPTVLLLREEVEVPDFWTPELQLSTILIAEAIEPLAVQLTPEQQVLRPYALGPFEIVPKFELNFERDEQFAPLFFVYNAGVQDGAKPNVTVEFDFHQQTADGEEFFNRTSPQEFNGQTLPPDFDLTIGHQIVAGQQIPLSIFPAGSYRLEIKVTDHTSGSVVTHNVAFSVEA